MLAKAGFPSCAPVLLVHDPCIEMGNGSREERAKAFAMTSTINGQDRDDPQEPHTIALWNLHRNLARLADELALVAKDAGTASDNASPSPASNIAEALSPRAYFEALLRLRRTREQYFGNKLFGEPAWDIMIELMLARIDGQEKKTSELGAFLASSDSERRTFVDALIESRLVERFHNGEDESDDYVALSSEAARRMAELYRARTRS